MRVQEGNILDVRLWGGRDVGRRERKEGEGSGWYPTIASQTRRREPEQLHLHQTSHPTQGKDKPGWTGIEEETPQTPSPRYHHHIYEIGNTDSNNPPSPPQRRKRTQTRLGWHQMQDTSPHLGRTCTQHGTKSWYVSLARRPQLSQQGWSLFQAPGAGSPPCLVCVCVCAGDTTKPFGSLCWCFATDGRTDGKEEKNFILHLASSYGCACGVRVVDLCAVCCCMDFQKGESGIRMGKGRGEEGGT